MNSIQVGKTAEDAPFDLDTLFPPFSPLSFPSECDSLGEVSSHSKAMPLESQKDYPGTPSSNPFDLECFFEPSATHVASPKSLPEGSEISQSHAENLLPVLSQDSKNSYIDTFCTSSSPIQQITSLTSSSYPHLPYTIDLPQEDSFRASRLLSKPKQKASLENDEVIECPTPRGNTSQHRQHHQPQHEPQQYSSPETFVTTLKPSRKNKQDILTELAMQFVPKWRQTYSSSSASSSSSSSSFLLPQESQPQLLNQLPQLPQPSPLFEIEIQQLPQQLLQHQLQHQLQFPLQPLQQSSHAVTSRRGTKRKGETKTVAKQKAKQKTIIPQTTLPNFLPSVRTSTHNLELCSKCSFQQGVECTHRPDTCSQCLQKPEKQVVCSGDHQVFCQIHGVPKYMDKSRLICALLERKKYSKRSDPVPWKFFIKIKLQSHIICYCLREEEYLKQRQFITEWYCKDVNEGCLTDIHLKINPKEEKKKNSNLFMATKNRSGDTRYIVIAIIQKIPNRNQYIRKEYTLGGFLLFSRIRLGKFQQDKDRRDNPLLLSPDETRQTAVDIMSPEQYHFWVTWMKDQAFVFGK